MTTLHIAQIGDLFDVESIKFLVNHNLLEYDFLIIDIAALTEEITRKSLKTIESRIEDIRTYIKMKDIPVAFICSDVGEFVHFNGERTDNIFRLLNLDVEANCLSGRKIEINANSPFALFLKKNASEFEYEIGFTRFPGNSLGNAKSKNTSVGFFTNEFVFLPTFADESQIVDDDLLAELYAVCKIIRKDQGQIELPKWTENYFLPTEVDQRLELETLKRSMKELEKKMNNLENKIADHSPLKQLWTGTGQILENAVRDVFKELGFIILDSEPGRDDLIMKWKDQIVIAEIKGQSKSAAEKNAAQLEKWASSYLSNEGVKAKGLLIVNAFREVPLSDRTQEPFPHQMLSYSIQREHCLLTTLQLCCLLLDCRSNPEKRESEVGTLLDCVGQYQNYLDWRKYISYTDKITDTKKKHNTKKRKASME